MSPSVIIVGAGISGCAAALTAKKAGADVILIERTDTLLNGARRAGRLFNGALVAWQEAQELGAGEIFDLIDSIVLHRKGIAGERRCVVYDCGLIEPVMYRFLKSLGIDILTETRVIDAAAEDQKVVNITLHGGKKLEADSFVDASGTAGGLEICTKHGGGCVMCLYKCPVFGDRVSIATRVGGTEFTIKRVSGKPGKVGAAVSVHKRSLSAELRQRLKTEGSVLIPIPADIIDFNLRKLPEQLAGRTEEQMHTLNLVDLGIVAKLVGAAYMPLAMLKGVPGFENVAIEEPPGASKYNKITGMSLMLHDYTLRVDGFNNLFCAGEHSGTQGVADCLTTGLLAGHNAVRAALNIEPIVLGRNLLIGESIAFFADGTRTGETLKGRVGNMGQGPFYEHIVKMGLYSENPGTIKRRVEESGFAGVFNQKLMRENTYR